MERIYKFNFRKHPFAPFKFNSGEIELVTNKTDTAESLTDIRLWFVFEKKSEAEKAYKYLVDTFSKLSTRKRETRYKDTRTAEFTNESLGNVRDIIFLVGKADGIIRSGYTLLFGFGNDLGNDKRK
jgi:hypothetical protein